MRLARLLARPRAAVPDIVSTARSHVGRVRQVNEDRVLDRPERGLWAVADGMGGHFGGDIAAERAVAALRRLADGDCAISVAALCGALRDANGAIHDHATNAHGTCGTTIVALHIDGDAAQIVWAGDSRAYLIRAGAARQLTSDHTLVQEMVDAGALDAEAARHHPNANVVTRALGVAPTVRVDEIQVAIRPGDRVLLCSDGLSSSFAADDFADTAAVLENHADALLARALERDGSDNISLVLIEV